MDLSVLKSKTYELSCNCSEKHWPQGMPLQISNEIELKTAWDHYMEANDRWKNIEAQKQAKLEIKVCSYKLHVS